MCISECDSDCVCVISLAHVRLFSCTVSLALSSLPLSLPLSLSLSLSLFLAFFLSLACSLSLSLALSLSRSLALSLLLSLCRAHALSQNAWCADSLGRTNVASSRFRAGRLSRRPFAHAWPLDVTLWFIHSCLTLFVPLAPPALSAKPFQIHIRTG